MSCTSCTFTQNSGTAVYNNVGGDISLPGSTFVDNGENCFGTTESCSSASGASGSGSNVWVLAPVSFAVIFGVVITLVVRRRRRSAQPAAKQGSV